MRTGWLAKRVVLRRRVLCAALAMLWGVLRTEAAEPYECHVEAFSANRLLVTIEINDYNVRSIQGVDGKVRSVFHVVGAPNVLEKGSPALPYVAKVLPVPYAGAAVRVLDANYEELSVAPPLPSCGSVVAGSVEARAPRVEGAAYRDTAAWPREISVLRAVAGSEGELRLLVYPFRYSAKRGKVLLARRVQVEVLLPSAGLKSVRGWGEWQARGGAASGRCGGDEGRGRLLVIYAKEFEGALTDFLHFKRMTGLTVEAVSFDANGRGELRDTAAVRQHVKRVYEEHPDDLRYVLFVGSFRKVPSKRLLGIKRTTVSDWLYSPVSPRYGAKQVSFGRLPAESVEDLRLMLEKTMRYERGEFESSDWLVRALGVASGEKDLGYSGRTDAQHVEALRGVLRDGGYQQVKNLSDIEGGARVQVEEVVEAVNKGVGVVNYVGHGVSSGWRTSGMSTADAKGLKNRGMWPMVISAACDNGLRIGAQPSFAEGWLLAHDGDEPTGAIAFLGATDEIVWEPPMLAQEEMNRLLLKQGMPNQPMLTTGDIFTSGLVKMIEAYGGEWGVELSADEWHLFGDPSVLFRSKKVRRGESRLPRLMMVGMQMLPVACAEEGSVVTFCRMRDGAAPIYQSVTAHGGRVAFTDLDVQEGDRVQLSIVHANSRMEWAREVRVAPRQNAQLVAYPYMKRGEETQSGGLVRGEELELLVDVVNVSTISMPSSLPLHLEVEPEGVLTLLPGSSELRLPPLGVGESLQEALRFRFKVEDVKGVKSVRVRLLVGGVSGRKALMDRVIPCGVRAEDLGVKEGKALLVAPNPAADAVRLKMGEGVATVRFYTLQGQCVLDVQGHGEAEVKVGLSGLANGVYLVVVENVNGGRVSQKIVVSR